MLALLAPRPLSVALDLKAKEDSVKGPICRVGFTVLALLVTMAVFSVSEALEPARLTPDELKWVVTPSGVHVARLAGDDKTAGMYVIRLRFPANFKVQPHFHPDDRVTTVLSGTLHVGYGERFDEGALKPLPPGSIWTEPAKQPHFVWAKDGEVMLQVIGNGPSASTPVESKQ